jgi:tetratricopeptide (TPR) repeat protein
MAEIEEQVCLSPTPAAVVLDPAPAQPVADDPPRSRLGALLGVGIFLALLAFLLGSFPARNSDLWLHLAAGKQLVSGESPFAPLPGLPAELQVNQTGLYNLLCYALYSALGGTALVVLKALLVAGLALVLLRLSRVEEGWGIAAACTALALLAMSIRLLLQPATVSCLLLALTLWCLWRPASGRRGGFLALLPPWPLLVLFVVWVNVDRWFLLGLATVVLVWIGQLADDKEDSRFRLLRIPLSFVLLLAACLLNPAFLLHASSVRIEQLLPSAVAGANLTSPFQEAYLADVGSSPAGLAYFPLLVLGGLSFALNASHFSWQRFLPWLGLALLSVFQVRTIPFFAVVAGPVLALNLREGLRERFGGHQGTWRRLTYVGHTLSVMLGLVLLVAAWPGCLQAQPSAWSAVAEPRRWAVEPVPSLERGAVTTRHWHQEGKIGADSRALHLSPDSVYAFAWFCPEDPAVLDARLAAAVLDEKQDPKDLAKQMRAAGIDRVVLYDTDRDRLFTALNRLLADPKRWPLLYLEGDLAVFGWRDPARAGGADPFRNWEMDLNRPAFRPSEDEKAPRSGPDREPEPRFWWEAFWKPVGPRPIDRDQALLHLWHAEALRRTAPLRHMEAWEGSQSASLVASASTWSGPAGFVDALVRFSLYQPQEIPLGTPRNKLSAADRLSLGFRERFTLKRDDIPPALLYLAIRAARRALVVNPDDARAHLVLGESYLRLLYATRERSLAERMPELRELRQVQASAALNRALALRPDYFQAHLSLADLYQRQGYLDLALNHWRAYLALVPNAPEAAHVERLATVVQTRENEYKVGSAGMPILDRVLFARHKGLAGKAREMLLESHIAAFGIRGLPLAVELQLKTGRVRDVRESLLPEHLLPEHRTALGPSYHWMRALALAASGEYALVREEFSEMLKALGQDSQTGQLGHLRETMALVVAKALLEQQPGEKTWSHLIRGALNRLEFPVNIGMLTRLLHQEADVTVLRGLLAFEQGDVGEAEVDFRECLSLWQSEAAAASGRGLDFNGRAVAQSYLKWLE